MGPPNGLACAAAAPGVMSMNIPANIDAIERMHEVYVIREHLFAVTSEYRG